MSQQELLERISTAHDKNTKLESRIRKLFYIILCTFGIPVIAGFADVVLLHSETKEIRLKQTVDENDIKELKRTCVTYEHLLLFNRTYELQSEEIQATIKGRDPAEILAIHKKI